MKRLDKYGSTNVPFAADDGWKKGSVTVHVPNTSQRYTSESASPQFLVSGIHYCPLLEVIKAACQSPKSETYHWVPFKLLHQTPLTHMRTYTDIYNSDAMLKEDAKIRAMEQHPDNDPSGQYICTLATFRSMLVGDQMPVLCIISPTSHWWVSILIYMCKSVYSSLAA